MRTLQSKTRAMLLAAVVPVAAVAMASSAQGANIIHRYSFNGTNANDSVGTAHGVVVVNNVVDATNANNRITGGQLDLSANTNNNNVATNSYVDLPNNIMGSGSGFATNFTVEGWATWTTASAWQRFFDFGTRTTGEILPGAATNTGDGTTYFFVTPQTGNDSGTGRINKFNAELNSGGSDFVNAPDNSAYPTTGEHLFTLTRTGTATAGTLTLYLDGVQVAQNTNATHDPNTITYNNDWIGRSNWSGDPFFVGRINEFRIFSDALTPGQVALEFAGGPNGTPVPEPTGVAALAAAAAAALSARRRDRNRESRG